ncbi:ribonuclease HI family protein [Candidatus Parcubacteria bacterium]|nr:ribonuclease HI family protein [Candidatus Parcubacteria bacterium]
MNKIIIYTDGGSRGNPGPSAIGVVISDEKGNTLKEYFQYLGDGITNNEAEYQAVIFALKKIKLLFGKEKAYNSEIEINSDSELLVNQLNGKYKILEPNLQPLFLKVWNLKIDFKKLTFKSIPREQNKEADRLVNQALDAQNSNKKLF